MTYTEICVHKMFGPVLISCSRGGVDVGNRGIAP